MHELSVAQSLIELASEAAARDGSDRVCRLYIRLGALSGVVKEALEFSFDLAAEETPCAGATLEIEEVPITVLCAVLRRAEDAFRRLSILLPDLRTADSQDSHRA